MFTNSAAVFDDLFGVRVFLFGYVAEFFEQREVTIRFDVALGARIAIPVPGATKVATFFDNANVFDARVTQASARLQATKPAANQHDVNLVSDGFTLYFFGDVRVFEVMGKLPGHLHVLLVAVVA